MMTCFKWVFTSPLPSTTKNDAILALLIDCHDPGKTVSREPNIYSGSFNNAEQFPKDISFNYFYIKAK